MPAGGMVYVKRRSALPPDTLIGVFLALTLGVGICLLVAVTRRFNIHQVESVMFGSLLTVTDGDLVLLAAAGLWVAALMVREYNGMLLDSLSPPLAGVAAGGLGRGRGPFARGPPPRAAGAPEGYRSP